MRPGRVPPGDGPDQAQACQLGTARRAVRPRTSGSPHGRTGLKLSPLWGKLWNMSTIAEIETAIQRLSPQEQQQLREWLLERGQPQSSTVPVGRKLLALSGAIKTWPNDFAANHDHYLHGALKRKAP